MRFLETLACSFSIVHGNKIKEAYLEFFTRHFSRLASRIEAEPNLMEWKDVVERIMYQKLLEFLGKPRYNSLSSRLHASLVLVSSDDFFKRHWFGAAELVIARIRDKYLETADFQLVYQLLYVYFFRYPEAWATMSQRLEDLNRSIVSISSHLLGNSDNIHDYIQYIVISGLKLTRFTFNSLIQPLLIVTGNPTELGLKKILIGITSYVEILKRLQRRQDRPEYPASRLEISGRLRCVTEDFFSEHIQIDLSSIHSQYCSLIGQVLMYLDENVLWDDTLYEGREVHISACETAISSVCLVFDCVPEIVPMFSDPRLFTMIVVKYLYYDSTSLRKSAFAAVKRSIEHALVEDSEEIARKWEMLFWSLAASMDASNERCFEGRHHCCELISILLDVPGKSWKYLPESDRESIVAELTIKSAIFSMDPRYDRIVPLIISLTSELASSIDPFSMPNENYVELKKAMNVDKITSQLLINSLKDRISTQLIDLTASINSQRDRIYFNSEESACVLAVYSNYVRFFLSHGALHVADGGKKKGRRVSISFSSSDTLHTSSTSSNKNHIRSIAALCQQCLPFILHDSAFIRNGIVDAFQSCSPEHLETVLLALMGYGKIISDDLRNIKYRFSRRNRRSDQLKLDLTRILAGLMNNVLIKRPDLFPASPSSKPPPCVQFLLKSLLETFYFCSEIDMEATLPALRINLGGMVAGWSKTILDSCRLKPIRFQYLPYKLHSEIWLTLRRWLQMFLLEEQKDDAASGNYEVASIIDAMTVLCWGIQTPSPGNRQDGVSLSQFFQWTDQLVQMGAGDQAREGIERLIMSNPAIVNRIIDKAYSIESTSIYDQIIISLAEHMVSREQKYSLITFKNQIKIIF